MGQMGCLAKEGFSLALSLLVMMDTMATMAVAVAANDDDVERIVVDY
jgi:hypothetical protein